MLSPKTPDQGTESPASSPPKPVITPLDFSRDPQPIETFAVRDDFPQCALGAHVDIRGFVGVVVEIVNQSIKVSSSEGVTQRFNSYRLKVLSTPPEHIEAVPTTRNIDRPKSTAAEVTPSRPAAPPRVYIADPDFNAPVRPITDFANEPEFPQCAYGKHVDVVGYAGVVVEIVNGSLKIQSPEGGIRSYNAQVLRKLYGKA